MSEVRQNSRTGFKVASIVMIFAGPLAFFWMNAMLITELPEFLEDFHELFLFSHETAIILTIMGVIFSVMSAGVKWWLNALYSMTVIPFVFFMAETSYLEAIPTGSVLPFFMTDPNSSADNSALSFLILVSIPLAVLATTPVFTSFYNRPTVSIPEDDEVE